VDVHIGDDLLEGSPELNLLVGIKEFLSAEHFGQEVTTILPYGFERETIFGGFTFCDAIQKPTHNPADAFYIELE